jgi:hypothetical protein
VFQFGVLTGEARGLNAQGGAGSSVGKVSASSTASSTGYIAIAASSGISNSYFAAGAASGVGKVTAGNGSVGAGSGVYGVATATATSNDPGAKAGTTSGVAYGIFDVEIEAANAYSEAGTAGNSAYGAYGQVGNVSGKGTVTATTGVGTTAYGLGVGIGNEFLGGVDGSPLIRAGNAFGYTTATAGKGVVGAVYGLGKADLSKGAPTFSSNAVADGLGTSYLGTHGPNYNQVRIYAGYADATATKGTATGGAGSSIASVTGTAFGYSAVSAKTGTAESGGNKLASYNYGIWDGTFSVGGAVGNTATAGAGSIGKVSGSAKSTATGFSATARAMGTDQSNFYASDASTAAAGSIGAGSGIYGYAYASAQSAGGGSLAHAYGLENLRVYAGVGAKAGTGAIGTISGIGKAYALDPNKGTYIADSIGMIDGDVNAGGTAAAIGKFIGYGAASNSAGKTTPTGADAYATGIARFSVTSGGSIGAITGSAFQGSADSSFPHINAGLYNSTFTAGTSIGIIKGTNTGTGDFSAGIYRAYVTAGTTISGVYGKIASSDSNAISGSQFRAINTGGTGATSAIGYVTGVTGSGTQGFGVGNSIFTTSGSIGAVNVTGSMYGGGIFAGDDLGSTFAIDDATVTTGASVGNVNISGYFTGSDIVASVDNGGRTYFGNTSDSGTTGALGAVTIGKPATPSTTAGTTESYAIESGAVGTVKWGGATITTTSPGTDVNDSVQYVHVVAI